MAIEIKAFQALKQVASEASFHPPIITDPPFLVKRLARERDLNYNPVLPRRVTAKFKAGNNPHNRQDSPHITAARWLTASPAVEFLNFLTTLVKRLA